MERMQSTWENQVAYNLSESGVHPPSVRALLDDETEAAALLEERLVYPQSNGTPALRAAIAALYPGTGEGHVQVTNGGAEANFLVLWRLVEPGDEVVMLAPNYMQVWGLARAFGAAVRQWWLRPDERAGRWRVDPGELDRLVGRRTRLVAICTPNNPTGARLTDEDLDAVARAAARAGAWVLSDEVYRGAELDGTEAPSMWGRYERTVVTGGLSKAYGLPGLRIGWIVGPPDLVESCWAYHDYVTIAPAVLSERLARAALHPVRRARLLARTRDLLRTNLPVLEGWLRDHTPGFSWIAPEAGAILYARYHYAINSTALAERLRETQSVLVVPGDHFGMDGYLRIGFGEPHAYLRAALERVHAVLAALPLAAPAPRA